MVPAMYTANSARLMGTPQGMGIAIWLHTAVRAANRAHKTIRRTRRFSAVFIIVPLFFY